MQPKLIFRFHSLQRMFERNITHEEVIRVRAEGKEIEAYPTDQPFPSYLKLGMINGRPIHVVAANDSTENSQIIITVYEPDPSRWESGYERRKK